MLAKVVKCRKFTFCLRFSHSGRGFLFRNGKKIDREGRYLISNDSLGDRKVKKLVLTALGAVAGLMASAQAAPLTLPVTIGPVTLTADGLLTDAVVRGTGAGSGIQGDIQNSPGYGIGDSVLDFLDTDLETEATLQDDDFVELFFANSLVNGDGFDFVIIEVLNQGDSGGLVLDFMGIDVNDVVRLDATQIVAGADNVVNGAYDFDIDGDGTIENGEQVFIYGFDLSDIGVGVGETLSQSIFLSASSEGAADIAHIGGINLEGPTEPPAPEVPLPAAAPLFLAGIAGLQFARRSRRKVQK